MLTVANTIGTDKNAENKEKKYYNTLVSYEKPL
jgi:hypothetical protein